VKVASVAGLPVEKKRETLRAYRWSSYRGYAGLGPAEEMINYRWLRLVNGPSAVRNRCAYRRYVEGFLVKGDEVLLDAMGASSYAIGDEDFRDQMEDGLLGARMRRADKGDIVWPEAKTVSMDQVESEVAREFGVEVSDLRFHGHRLKTVKAVAVELCCQLTGKTQREVGARFGYRSESSVGKQRKHLAQTLKEDRRLIAGMRAVRRRLAQQC